jgi:hypothetical protein
LATPNYGYEKRQKELAKKRKKEDKLKAKSERKLGEAGDELLPVGHEDGVLSSDTPAAEPEAAVVPPAV